MTPGTRRNSSSTPQKQPAAKVAFSILTSVNAHLTPGGSTHHTPSRFGKVVIGPDYAVSPANLLQVQRAAVDFGLALMRGVSVMSPLFPPDIHFLRTEHALCQPAFITSLLCFSSWNCGQNTSGRLERRQR
jgi:hypothetical protein